MIQDLLRGDRCAWCESDLGDSFLMQFAAVERGDRVYYPTVCCCGGINVVRGGTFVPARGPAKSLNPLRRRPVMRANSRSAHSQEDE